MVDPIALTPEARAKLIDAMRIGCYQVEAANYAGIHENTLVNWLRSGRADIADGNTGTPCATLVTQMKEAESQAIVRGLTVVQRAAAQGDWRAAMAWLSRRHVDRWGKVAVSVEAQGLADEVKALIGALTEDTGDEPGDGDPA